MLKKKSGFSNASKLHRAKQKARPGISTRNYIFLDIETTGLNVDTDQIIELGAVKISGDKETEFHRMIKTEMAIPESICRLTGIDNKMIEQGETLENAMRDLLVFIQGAVLIGYNINFDLSFLNRAMEKFSLGQIHNKIVDLMAEVKKKNSFQDNYKFETTLREYEIDKTVPHRALEDAKLMRCLYDKMKTT